MELELPGFRFHPTEEELLEFYLKQAAHGRKLKFDIIPTVHLYRHDPWDLPALAGDIVRHGSSSSACSREWYFFVPRDGGRKLNQQQAAGRPSRTTERGFWKATGSDRAVRCGADPKRLIGLKKTLVYYQGRAPRGSKTDWVMNEYRLPEHQGGGGGAMAGGGGKLQQDHQELVLCKVYRKAVTLKELEQRVAMEELARSSSAASSHCTGSPDATGSMSSDVVQYEAAHHRDGAGVGGGVKIEAAAAVAVARPAAMRLPELETTRPEWISQPQQDPFQLTSSQLRSPWMMESFCFSPCYQSSLLNF